MVSKFHSDLVQIWERALHNFSIFCQISKWNLPKFAKINGQKPLADLVAPAADGPLHAAVPVEKLVRGVPGPRRASAGKTVAQCCSFCSSVSFECISNLVHRVFKEELLHSTKWIRYCLLFGFGNFMWDLFGISQNFRDSSEGDTKIMAWQIFPDLCTKKRPSKWSSW